ncbi:site-specific integrase [Massilia sp. DJPM01]|uniref:site-specific integrase n=1 Tax=Massilia sp. DJPM01 TaxID=3024404 RepID=UPI00259DF73A|nr:site-specific integrase [Massilia sp. DJPM01]MDM5182201.1 site-specific integrase [Massilia sp. DJPM01]
MHAVEGELDAIKVWLAIDAARAKLVPYADLLRAPFSLLIDRYIADVTPLKKGRSSETARLNALRRSALATYKMAELTRPVLAQWRDARLKQVASGTVLRELAIIQNIIEIARREWGLDLAENPLVLLKKPTPAPPRERRPTDAELDAILREAERSRGGFLRDVVVFAIETGMRQGEIAGLDWRFVNLSQRRIHLTMTKNGSTRGVPLSRKALAVLESQPSRSGSVFQGATPEAIKRAFQNACKRAGVKDLRFHDLRHEATSRYFEKGLSMMEVASITGHKSLSMLQRYTHLDAGKLAHRLD